VTDQKLIILNIWEHACIHCWTHLRIAWHRSPGECKLGRIILGCINTAVDRNAALPVSKAYSYWLTTHSSTYTGEKADSPPTGWETLESQLTRRPLFQKHWRDDWLAAYSFKNTEETIESLPTVSWTLERQLNSLPLFQKHWRDDWVVAHSFMNIGETIESSPIVSETLKRRLSRCPQFHEDWRDNWIVSHCFRNTEETIESLPTVSWTLERRLSRLPLFRNTEETIESLPTVSWTLERRLSRLPLFQKHWRDDWLTAYSLRNTGETIESPPNVFRITVETSWTHCICVNTAIVMTAVISLLQGEEAQFPWWYMRHAKRDLFLTCNMVQSLHPLGFVSVVLYLCILLRYFTYSNTASVTMQPRTYLYILLLSSQHVSALAGHHQVLLFMLKLSNCIAYHFY
jgi:hypothetical protein